MEIVDLAEFIHYYTNVRKRTKKVINDIQLSNFDFRPTPDAFSVADILRHLASISLDMFGENIQFHQSKYAGHGPELADTPESVLTYLNSNFEKLISILKTYKHDDLYRKCMTPAGVEITVWKWLRSMVEHEIHHRGELYVYGRLIGQKTTPLYGLTSEQVKERSV